MVHSNPGRPLKVNGTFVTFNAAATDRVMRNLESIARQQNNAGQPTAGSTETLSDGNLRLPIFVTLTAQDIQRLEKAGAIVDTAGLAEDARRKAAAPRRSHIKDLRASNATVIAEVIDSGIQVSAPQSLMGSKRIGRGRADDFSAASERFVDPRKFIIDETPSFSLSHADPRPETSPFGETLAEALQHNR